VKHRTQIRAAALTLMWAMLASCNPDASLPEIPAIGLVEPAIMVGGVALDHVVSPENDGFGFALSLDVRLIPGGAVVLENQLSRLVVFDEDFRPVRTIGQPGQGPGELQRPYSLEVRGNRIAVGEINNQRISVFHMDGSIERSFPVPKGMASFAIGANGTIYVNADSPEFYLLAVDDTNGARLLARRATEFYPQSGGQPRMEAQARGRDLVAVAGGRIHVFDPTLGGFAVFDTAGARQMVRRLPAQVFVGLRAGARMASRDFGGSGRGDFAPANDLTVTDSGDLFLSFPPVAGILGLVIDPVTYAGRPVQWDPDDPSVDSARGFGAAMLRTGRLYGVTLEDLRVHQVREPRP
jgi:hypothetical protein